MPKLSRTTVKPLPKLHWVKQKFEELPGVKFSLSLPGVVLNALEGHDDLEASLIGDIARTIGTGKQEDYQLAKRIRKLQLAKVGNGITSGTIPELVLHDWLSQNGYQFEFQPWLSGGRGMAGGVVPDFVINVGGQGVVWLPHGEYWHSKPDTMQSDAVDIALMLGQDVNGLIITKVVQMWEQRIYRDRPQIFQFGIAGIELGR
jgi:hypothetical protein